MTTNMTLTVTPLLEREFNPAETMAILRSSGPVLWSWGANDFRNIADKGLLFKVSGHHHKGSVLITLAWNDTYTIHLISPKSILKETITNIYFDELVDIIDVKVERIPEYAY